MFNSLNIKELVDKMKEPAFNNTGMSEDINEVIRKFNDRNGFNDHNDTCGKCIFFNASWTMCEHLWQAVYDDTKACASFSSHG